MTVPVPRQREPGEDHLSILQLKNNNSNVFVLANNPEKIFINLNCRIVE
jgi:hypothetical protein